MPAHLRIRLGTAALTLALAVPMVSAAHAAPTPGSLRFSNTALTTPNGNSEPKISIGADGTMAMVGLQWLFDPTSFGTNLWTGPFGSTPTFQGIIDAGLQQQSKAIIGAHDADVDMGATGTLHATTLLRLNNPAGGGITLAVSAITCANPASSGFTIASNCTEQILDNAGSGWADRPWVTSDGPHVYISYADAPAFNLSVIHVQRSDDDGATWQRVADPIVGQGGATGDATHTILPGPIKADPVSHNVYDVYAAGDTGLQKSQISAPNHIYVARSTDMGKSWTTNLVYTAPTGTSLANVFPALAVDPTNGKVYAAWSDGHTVSFAASSDQGVHWSAAVSVNSAPASTAVFPWLAAYNGAVDLVYYGTAAASDMDVGAVWNVYLGRTTDGGASFTQSLVSNSSNHTGPVCTGGDSCGPSTRNLLDLFQVAIDPQNGKAAVIYIDDTLTTTTGVFNFTCAPGQTVCPLPQAVLAQQR